jgi:hypothetical protein
MEKPRDIRNELITLREEVMRCFQEVPPEKKFAADMGLAIVRLHMIEADIHRTRNLDERRRLIHEFTRRRDIIQKRLRLPQWVEREEPVPTGQKCRQAVS